MEDVNFDISSAPPSTEFTNTATVHAFGYCASAQAKFKVCNYADLYVTKVTTKHISYMFEDFIYIINVVNNGPSNATDVILTDILSPDCIYKSINLTQGTYKVCKDKLTCYLGDLKCNDNAMAVIVVVPQHQCILTDKTFVTANEYDTNYNNNFFTTNTKVYSRRPIYKQSIPFPLIILILFLIYN